MSETLPITLSYFEQRMRALGVTPEANKISILQYDADKKDNVFVDVPVFSETEKGINILVYQLDRTPIRYKKEGSRWNINDYCITRLSEPIVKKNGDTIKYLMPAKQETHPFFPPPLVKLYEDKTPFETLYITEGYFKAYKGALHGLPVVGLSSITHMREKATGAIYSDIKTLIKTCKVKRVVWLTDGDCLDITTKEITEQTDLYKRPHGFFNSAHTFSQLLAESDVERYFAHINSEELPGKPKGLDDLLCALPGKEQEVVADLLSFSKPGYYTYREDITFSTKRLYRYFNLDNVNNFFLFHSDRRKELRDKKFKWNGTVYLWNEEKSECHIQVPGDASNYFRVGDQYHKYVSIPNKYQQLEKTFHRRQKSTITDDHGKTIIRFIPKYDAFCNVPSHTDYQRVINNNFNMYSPFEHEPTEEDCTEADFPNIVKLFKHIFGTGDITFTHPETREKITVAELDLGYDYVQILYKMPWQTLPILCLVSKQNNTGKSTFGKFLKMLFTSNAAVVGNSELANDFNASYAGKLLIICDETKIDKDHVIEKVKSLSTADKIFMNSKGKDHNEIDFFGKFLFFSNNEDNFLPATEDDVRYWVRKIPEITERLNVDMMTDMRDEIPHFLSFITKRKMATEKLHRGWFHPPLLKTEALRKLVAYSRPTIEKELRQFIKTKFLDFGVTEFKMTLQAIHMECFKGSKYEKNYLETTLKERLKVDLFHRYEFDGRRFPNIEALKMYSLDNHGSEDIGILKAEKRYVSHRHSYPTWIQAGTDSVPERKRGEMIDNGRPYVFYRDAFLTSEELAGHEVDPEQQYITDMVTNVNNDVKPVAPTATQLQINDENNEDWQNLKFDK